MEEYQFLQICSDCIRTDGHESIREENKFFIFSELISLRSSHLINRLVEEYMVRTMIDRFDSHNH